MLFDFESRHVLDGSGASAALLGYDLGELRGLPLGQLFDAAADEPWPHAADAAPPPLGVDWLATLVQRDGRRRVLGARLARFGRGSGDGALGLLLLGELGAESGARPRGAQRRLQTLAYELTLAEARERERVANGLHDSLGQMLAIAQFRLGELAAALQSGAAADDGRLRDRLAPLVGKANELMVILAQASGETRRATFDLHSPLLRQLGLRTAIEGTAERLQRQGRAVVSVQGDLPSAAGLPEAVQAVLLRIVRELLLNAYKHADASTVQVVLGESDGQLEICVKDDGRGFVQARTERAFSPEGGFGFASAEAQMRAIGGRLSVSSAPGQGCTVRLVLKARRVRGGGRACGPAPADCEGCAVLAGAPRREDAMQ